LDHRPCWVWREFDRKGVQFKGVILYIKEKSYDFGPHVLYRGDSDTQRVQFRGV